MLEHAGRDRLAADVHGSKQRLRAVLTTLREWDSFLEFTQLERR
jgi:hypothetical protein